MKLVQSRLVNSVLLLVILLLPACATTPLKETPVSGNPAVLVLANTARSDIAVYQYGKAAASLERALRIEPRNARLWHDLAQVRLKEEEYQQAESLALRSNRFAGRDDVLRSANWKLIAESRKELGNMSGAQRALEKSGN
ncbi:MAG: tetratricopeptide repeat protein [Acidiferrobacterales bacterium]